MGIRFQDINDPCDCGSGLKLKDCHLKPNFPDEYFTVRITRKTEDYFEKYVNGQYRKIPGRVMMRVSVVDAEFAHQDIIDALKPLRGISGIQNIKLGKFDQIVKELKLEQNHDSIITWTNRLNKLQHKMELLKYHIKTYSQHEREFEEKCKNEYTSTIIEKEEIDPLYLSETESFLFQTKSMLDIIAQLIGMAYRLSGVVTYKNEGNDLIAKLRESSAHRDKMNNKEKMIKIIESNKDWIKYLVNMRDLITHYSDLIGFKSTIHTATSNIEEYANVYYPSMPNKERVTTFMNNTFARLSQLLTEISQPISEL